MLMMGVTVQVSTLTGGMNVATDLSPVIHAPKCAAPALFLHGEQDQLVQKTHSERNFAAYGGPKESFYFPGGHNDPRSSKVIDKAVEFLKKNLA